MGFLWCTSAAVLMESARLGILVLSRRADLSDPLPGVTRVYVGRPSPLGNPFPMRSEADRNLVVHQYHEWLRKQYRSCGRVRDELERLLVIAQAGPLELVCWCAPLACHADVIAEALNGMAITRAAA